MTHHHDREVVERGSGVGAVAVVAIVVLVILAALAMLAFGGLDWLTGGSGAGAGQGNDRPGVVPTLPDVEPVPPSGLFSPPVVLVSSG